MRDFSSITEKATKTGNGWTGKEIVLFHMFNPNGLMKQKRDLDEQISRLVEDGKAKSGAIIAHGMLDSFCENQLRDLMNCNRVNKIKLVVTLSSFRERNKKAAEFIESHS